MKRFVCCSHTTRNDRSSRCPNHGKLGMQGSGQHQTKTRTRTKTEKKKTRTSASSAAMRANLRLANASFSLESTHGTLSTGVSLRILWRTAICPARKKTLLAPSLNASEGTWCWDTRKRDCGKPGKTEAKHQQKGVTTRIIQEHHFCLLPIGERLLRGGKHRQHKTKSRHTNARK